jgi:predicted outer membrane protein
MSDANILGHLASVDSFEVALSDSAILKSKSDTVLGYARTMRSMHLGSRTAARQIGKDLNLPLTTIAGEMRRTHVFAPEDSLANASELTVDRHYLQQQIELHDHMLAELSVLQDVAKDDRVRENVRGRIPVVQSHLDYARQVAKAKGVSTKTPKH